MKKTLVCLSIVFSMASSALADPLPAKALDAAIANPVKIAAIMRGLKPEAREAAAGDLMRHAAALKLPAAQKRRMLARLTAACIAAVLPEERAKVAKAMVIAGGKDNVSLVVAAIALSAGADEAGQAIVGIAVKAAESLDPRDSNVHAEAANAARSPDVVLGAELSAEVVQTTQAVHRASVSPPPPAPVQTVAKSPDDEPPEHQPIAPPPTPPRAHPYEAQ